VEQAFLDGEVCVFNTWPVDASDADRHAESSAAPDREGIYAFRDT
jgi:hypothetical protein